MGYNTATIGRRPKPLGKNQKQVLELLGQRGSWYPGCGWLWQSYARTLKVLDSLVQHGLVSIGERRSPLTGGAVTEYKAKESDGERPSRERDGFSGTA
jgi:hypothetical protein